LTKECLFVYITWLELYKEPKEFYVNEVTSKKERDGSTTYTYKLLDWAAELFRKHLDIIKNTGRHIRQKCTNKVQGLKQLDIFFLANKSSRNICF
jgi:hypothetical protein